MILLINTKRYHMYLVKIKKRKKIYLLLVINRDAISRSRIMILVLNCLSKIILGILRLKIFLIFAYYLSIQ